MDSELRIVITRQIQHDWSNFCEARPGQNLPPLLEVIRETQLMPMQIEKFLNNDFVKGWQSPRFKSVVFAVKRNLDGEAVFLYMYNLTDSDIDFLNWREKTGKTRFQWEELDEKMPYDEAKEWILSQKEDAVKKCSEGIVTNNMKNNRLHYLNNLLKRKGFERNKTSHRKKEMRDCIEAEVIGFVSALRSCIDSSEYDTTARIRKKLDSLLKTRGDLLLGYFQDQRKLYEGSEDGNDASDEHGQHQTPRIHDGGDDPNIDSY